MSHELPQDYGKQIANALAAVQQLYADTDKLLQDCDGTVGKGKPSVFGNVVTRDLSRVIGGHHWWMPGALYRYYDARAQGPGLVEALTVSFQDEADVEPPRQDEPLLIVARIHYTIKRSTPLRSVCDPWNLWNAYFIAWENRCLNKVIALNTGLDDYISKLTMIAVPLYSIKAVHDVEQLIHKLRLASEQVEANAIQPLSTL